MFELFGFLDSEDDAVDAGHLAGEFSGVVGGVLGYEGEEEEVYYPVGVAVAAWDEDVVVAVAVVVVG